MAFNRGGAAAEKATQSKKKFAKTEWFNLQPGETTTLRFMDDSDAWIWVRQHSFVDTKGAPADASDEERKRWPAKMGATCRKDPGIGKDDCYICDQMTDNKNKPLFAAIRLWARAVVREEVLGTQEMADDGKIPANKVGRVVGFKDAEQDVEETDKDGNATGNVVRRKRIVVVNMGMKNFFSALQGYYDMNGTVLDRDYRITRKGEGTDTTYNIMMCQEIPGHDLTDPETHAKYEKYATEVGLSMDDIETMIKDKASDEFFARFFDPTKKVPPRKKKDSDDDAPASREDSTPAVAPVEDEPVDQDRLAAMRDRVRNGGKKKDPEPPATGALNFE